MSESKPMKLIVQNIVSNAHLGNNIDCELVVEALHARLNHQVFPALVSVCKEARTTNCCFASGQIVISGSRHELQAILSCYLLIARISRDLKRTDLQLYNFIIDNIVCSCDLGFPLNVDAFVQKNKTHCEYEPEQFPGAHWRTYDPPIGFVLFKSGRVACIGLKSYEQISIAQERLEILRDYEEGNEKVEFDGTRRRERIRNTNLKKLDKSIVKMNNKKDSLEFFDEFVQDICPKLRSLYDEF